MRASSSRRRPRGFTLLEAMISMMILAVGIMGIASMQSAATGATRNAQDFSQAAAIAERLTELLRTDALRWTSAAALTNSTLLLKNALPPTNSNGDQSAWATIPDGVIASTIGGGKFDRGFRPDALGQVDWPIGFRYCPYYRLAWAWYPQAMRADVRIAWARDEGDQSQLVDCVADRDKVGQLSQLPNIRMVSTSTLIMMNQP